MPDRNLTFKKDLISFITNLENEDEYINDIALRRIVGILKEINSIEDLKYQRELINRVAIDCVTNWDTIHSIGNFIKDYTK